MNIGSSAKILLVPGPAGSGKSALAHTVCSTVDSQGLLVCSTFFDHMGDPVTATDFMTALIRGLCTIDVQVKKAVAERLTKNPMLASAPALRQLMDIVLPILPKLPTTRTLVVGIDALDEQSDPTVMLQLLRDHVPRLPSNF